MSGKPELLAPAGDWEALVAAVENGADAVYLGGKLFNARHSAGNFENLELSRAVHFAHVRGVRVYVTVNTLLEHSEVKEAVRFLHFLYQCGADAAIIQDLGLLRLARKAVPELPLHASTQMTVHNLPALQLLKNAGISRVVLARELSLDAIREIVRSGGVGIEVFIHGALCVCYSGQCLMSSMIGGRSGNRGRCAQPCRLSYVLVDRQGRSLAEPGRVGDYLLSPRDLNLSERLPDLIEAGISSFKIEGRMKRPEYVATVVRIYRTLLDRAAAGGPYAVRPEEARDLAQIFNRDFTTGYFYGRPGRELMSYKRPNNRGVRLGRVKGFDRTSRLVEITLEEPLRTGDGIEVWVTRGGRAAGEVGRILLGGRPVERAPAGATVQLEVPGRVFPGDRVFKTHDADLMEQARTSFKSPGGQQKIPLVFTVEGRLGEPLRIRAGDAGGFTGEAVTASPVREAQKRPLTHEYLEKQLGRLGNTPFGLARLQCRLEGDLMVPVSEINEARRQALARLEEDRTAAFRRPPLPEDAFERRLAAALSGLPKDQGSRAGLPGPELSVVVGDLASLRAAVRAGAGEVCLSGEQYRSRPPVSLEDIFAGSEACARAGVRFILGSPRILQDGELAGFCRLLEKVRKGHLDGVMAGNLGVIKKMRELTGLPVFTDFSLNVFNIETVRFLLEAGVSRVTLSPELTLEQVRQMAGLLPLPAEVIVHGALPLMVSDYCVTGSLLGEKGKGGSCPAPCRITGCGLKDRKGIVFPVEMDQNCRMHIFNSRDLCVIDDLPELAGAGIAVLRIEARREGAGYVRDVTGAYRAALTEKPGGRSEERLAALKESLARYSPAGFTKGHFYRGVL
ncbi:MAG: DUF3656 domain-containing U32 family peptidase [Pelotomaculaceae bacterium]|jgi:putative protease|nr:DUF3656 domain-containing protein [Bacillota bacterium]HHU87418.1 peptidase U32 [Peptococcaceae bacterium]